MLLNRIELFLTVAKHKSLGKTTGEMHVSGSSVCQRLKLLENDFGVKLYKKYKGGIELTGAGRTLLATGTDVNIQMSPKYENLVMRIIDTGGGFPFPDDEVEIAANGAGPTRLRSRVASLAGSLSIRSAERGACLEIILPLSRQGVSNADHTGSLG